MSKKLTVAVVGATGAVGREMLKTLHERDFPATEIRAFASARSAGTKVPYGDKELTVQELKEDVFEGIDLAIFSAGGSTSQKFAPHAAHAGCVVVDNSAAWRMDERCPLIVPEVNAHALEGHNGIIANPNCSTIQMLVALKPLHDAAGITRINVATYQSVSGAGKEAVDELAHQTAELLQGRPVTAKVIAKQIAFNCVPQIDKFQDNGYTKEEMKMFWETQKIMGDKSIQVNATAVRVPVFFGHSEVINIETRKKKARRVIPRAKVTRIQGNTAAVRKRLKKAAGKARAAVAVKA